MNYIFNELGIATRLQLKKKKMFSENPLSLPLALKRDRFNEMLKFAWPTLTIKFIA